MKYGVGIDGYEVCMEFGSGSVGFLEWSSGVEKVVVNFKTSRRPGLRSGLGKRGVRLLWW